MIFRFSKRSGIAALTAMLTASTALADGVVFNNVTAQTGISYIQHELPADLYYPVHMSGGAAAGDFDNDGYVDLIVTRLDKPDILYRNMCNGTFADVTAGSGLDGVIMDSNGVGWADIDHDGDLDLYITGLWENGSICTSTTAPATSPKKPSAGARPSKAKITTLATALHSPTLIATASSIFTPPSGATTR